MLAQQNVPLENTSKLMMIISSTIQIKSTNNCVGCVWVIIVYFLFEKNRLLMD